MLPEVANLNGLDAIIDEGIILALLLRYREM